MEKAEAARSTLDKIQGDLGEDPEIDAIGAQAEVTRKQLHSFGISAEKILAHDQTLDALQGLLSDLHGLTEPIASWSPALTARTAALDADAKALSDLAGVWLVTLQSVIDGGAPPDVIESVRQVCDRITTLRVLQEKWMRSTLSLQNKVSEISAIGDEMGGRLANASVHAARKMLTRDTPPLWSSAAYDFSGNNGDGWMSANDRFMHISHYVRMHLRGVIGHVLAVLMVTLFFILVKNSFSRWGDVDDECVTAAVRVPLASAYVLSVITMVAFYPSPPRLFTFIIIITAISAAIVVLLPLVDARLRVAIFALLGLGVLDGTRAMLLSAVTMFRFALVVEQAVALMFLAWLLRSGRLQAARVEAPGPARLVSFAAWYGLIGFSLALIANVAGYVSLSRNFMNLTVMPLYLTLLLHACLRILDAIAFFFMRVWPLSHLASVSRNRDVLRKVVRVGVVVFTFGAWLRYATSQAPIASSFIASLTAFMNADLGMGGVTPLGIVMFVGVVALSFVCSRIVLALLNEDVYPRFALPSGVPFAISTMVHYALVLAGFLVALGLLGIDMTRFTLMVSAFGVGLGFGLQTIVNNLVSGIILLFERPVKIGDVIEMNNNRGTLTHIGLRASVLHASDGSDIILPNGTLLSSNVVNYTLADQQRRIEIEVQIPAGYDADKVMAMLTEQARTVENVLADPPPECLFVKFTDKQLVLQVRAWVATTDRWRSVHSSLNLAIYGTLLKKGIVATLELPSEKA